MVGKVVTKTGSTVQACGVFYKATLQLVLLYGSNFWLVTVVMLKVLEVLHNQAS